MFLSRVAVSPPLPLTVRSLQVGYRFRPLIFFFDYLFSWLIALPITAVVILRTAMASCIIGDAVAAIVPVALANVLSLLFANNIFTWRTSQDLIALFSLGAVFWLIAFWRVTP